jgi:hypothetical protein
VVADTVGPNGTLFGEFVEFLVVAVLVDVENRFGFLSLLNL